MKFDSLSAFLAMDGHGTYVWLAYGITFVIIAVNLWWPRSVRKSFIKAEKRFREREQNQHKDHS